MSLNPSNILDTGMVGFRTLGDPPFPEEYKDEAVAELRAAGLPRGSETLISREHEVYKKDSEAHGWASAGIHAPGIARPEDIEWMWLHEVEAKMHGWKFRRAWYYWSVYTVSEACVLPEAVAKEFNKEFGKEVRVDGCAGGQDVRGPVDGYHVDTPRGLAALVKLLGENNKRIEEARRKEWELDPK